jgi:hypothetical protein
MYQLIKSRGLSKALAQEGPAATSALGVAELFYKFHSFTLECLAFLATWYAFSLAFSWFWQTRRETQD